MNKPKEQALKGELTSMTNELFVGTCSQPSVTMDDGGGGMVMKQVQDMSGQVAKEQVWLWAEGVVASRTHDNWRGVSGQD